MVAIDPWILIKQSIFGLMPLILISILGIFLTTLKIFDKKTINSIALGYKNIFNPFFIFFNTVSVISKFDIYTLLPLMTSPFIMLLTGIFINFLHSLFFPAPKNYSRIVKCVIAYSNTANLPVVLLKGICSPYGPLNGNEKCVDSNSYIAIQFLVYTVIGWSYGWSMVSMEKQDSETLLVKNSEIFKQPSLFWSILNNLTLPGPVACFLAVIFGFIPGVSQSLSDKESVFYSVVDFGLGIGMTGVVFGQATLGSNLILLKEESRNVMSFSYILSVVFFKNFVMPAISIWIIYAAWYGGVFGENIVMAYYLFICFCSPTALLFLLICQNLEYGVMVCTWLMLGIYSFAIPTFIVFSYLFFILIEI